MDDGFSWMTYFVWLFVLVVLSLALSLLSPSGGRRPDLTAHPDGAGRHPDSERAR